MLSRLALHIIVLQQAPLTSEECCNGGSAHLLYTAVRLQLLSRGGYTCTDPAICMGYSQAVLVEATGWHDSSATHRTLCLCFQNQYLRVQQAPVARMSGASRRGMGGRDAFRLLLDAEASILSHMSQLQ